MAVVAVTTKMVAGVKYTVQTDSSADWSSVSNDTYFYDLTDEIVYYKNSSGIVLNIFSSSGASGSGTSNYLARWTPDGNTLGNSLIRDNGTTIGINFPPNSGSIVYVDNSTKTASVTVRNSFDSGVGITAQATGGGTDIYGASFFALSNSSTNNVGVNASAQGTISGTNVAGSFYTANVATSINYAVYQYIGVYSIVGVSGKTNSAGVFISEKSNTADNIGLHIQVSNAGSGNAYIGRFLDGNEGANKVLTSDASGNANWATLNDITLDRLTNYDNSPTANAFQYNCDLGASQHLDMQGSSADVTLTFVNQVNGVTYSLLLVQGSNLDNLVLPSGYWLNDTAPFDFTTLADNERAIITASYIYNAWCFAVKKLIYV